MRTNSLLNLTVFLVVVVMVRSLSFNKVLARSLDLERSEPCVSFEKNFPEHQLSNATLTTSSEPELLSVEAWQKWLRKVVPVFVCIYLVGNAMGGSSDTILMVSGMIVFGMMCMEIMEGGKIPFDEVGKEGLNNAANKINKLGRESVLIITGGIVISILAVLDFMTKKKVVADK